ncbi:hypothetical protein C7Y69_07495 [Alteromonas sp. KS69]|nr:hypothetical protein C7Y69_07495 [Alteromonas sp. KS69]
MCAQAEEKWNAFAYQSLTIIVTIAYLHSYNLNGWVQQLVMNIINMNGITSPHNKVNIEQDVDNPCVS